MCKNNILTLLAADTSVSCSELVGSTSCSCFLHHYRVSPAASSTTWRARACFGLYRSPHFTHPRSNWFLKSLDPGNTHDLCGTNFSTPPPPHKVMAVSVTQNDFLFSIFLETLIFVGRLLTHTLLWKIEILSKS